MKPPDENSGVAPARTAAGLWWPVGLAYATFVLIGLFAGVGGVLLPAQIADYGVDKTTIGMLFFTQAAGFVAAGATAGGLLARVGFRTALVIGGGVLTVAALGTAARPPLLLLLLVQVPVGYGMGMVESVLNAYLAGLSRATNRLNRLHAFFGVGALLGPLLATWVLRFAPWTTVWLVLAAAVVPLSVGFLTSYPPREPVRRAGPGPSGPKRPEPRLAGRRSQSERAEHDGLFLATLRRREVWLGTVLLTVYVGLEISVGNWGFSYLVEGRGQPDLAAGYAVSGFWLGLTLGRFLISPIAVRLGLSAAGMSAGCLVAVTAAAAGVWLLPGPVVAVAGLFALGFFLGPIFPTTMAVVPQVTESRLVPTAIGIMNAGSVVGGAALPWLAGALGQRVGVWTLLPYVVVLGLVQSAIWWRLARFIRSEPPATTEDEPPPIPAPRQRRPATRSAAPAAVPVARSSPPEPPRAATPPPGTP